MIRRRVLIASLVAMLGATSPFMGSASVAGAQSSARPGWDPLRAHREAGAAVSRRRIPDERARYVAANGDDAAAGTAEAPWRTVRRALRAARPDSTIVVYGRHPGHGNGVYRGQSWGHIRTRNVTIQAAPGERPWFLGTARVATGPDDWHEIDGAWATELPAGGAEAWPPNRYPIPDQVDEDRPQADDPEQLFELGDGLGDGGLLEPIDQADGQVERPAPLGDRFYLERRSGRSGGRLWLGSDPTSRTLEWSVRQTAVQVDPSGRGARIVGIGFEGYSSHHGNTLGAVRILADDVSLVDVTVRHSAGTGIAATGENGTLRHPLRNLLLRRVTASSNGALGATIGDAGGEGADDAEANNLRVEYSRFDDNNREGFDALDCGSGRSCVLAGMKLVRVNGLVARFSTFEHNAAAGLWCDLYCEHLTIVGNHVADNLLSGIFVEVSRSTLLASNVVAGNGSEGDESGAIKITGSVGVRLEHNTVVDNAAPALTLGADRRDDDDAPAWHSKGTGIPSVTVAGNLFAPGPEERSADIVAGIGSEPLTGAWTELRGNGYALGLSGSLPGEDGIARRLVAPAPADLFRDPASGDFRVVDPSVTRWRGARWSRAARTAVGDLPATREVGAAYAS